ncbi:MAG: YdcF family protein [Bacteroidales bacterium]|nr:YdcF family protein [Bacteroidales bacterium]
MKITFGILKWLFISLGIITVIINIFALTPLPFYMHRSLGEDASWENDSTTQFTPDYIIMFGGAGMPSESNLIRLHYTAEIACKLHKPIILVHPKDSLCQAEMTQYLVNYGIASDSIMYMTDGSNTRSQAVCLADSFPQLKEASSLIITAPEHLSRTLKCLKKCEIENIRGIGTFESTVDFDLSIDNQTLKGNRYIPDVESTNLRYTYWNYLRLEIICFREYFATAYYWAKDWI